VPNQELLALGAANIAGGLFGAMPAGGGTTQTAVNRSAGARSQIAGIVTAAATLAALLVLAPLIAPLPQAALAAVVARRSTRPYAASSPARNSAASSGTSGCTITCKRRSSGTSTRGVVFSTAGHDGRRRCGGRMSACGGRLGRPPAPRPAP
jgi:hypothetical protein